jgi:nicotinamidase
MPLIIPGITPVQKFASKAQTSDKFIPALVVVDVQTDFVSGSLAVPDAQSIIEPINSILSLPFALKVGTKDFHPPGHISFASTHNKSVGEKITIYRPDVDPPDTESGIEQCLWPDHCVQSTPGSEFTEGFDSSALHAVVHKGTHPGVECYSAFGDPWGLTTMELPNLLSAKEVTDVFVVGLAGDYCVKSTAIDAVNFTSKTASGLETKLRTWVVKDLVRSVGNEGKEWDEMEKAGVMFVESDEVKARLENKQL